MRDFVAYCTNYVQEGHRLHLEEVVTIDPLRTRDSVSLELRRHRVFDPASLTVVAQQLLHRGLLYRIDGWRQHCDTHVQSDLGVLLAAAYDENEHVDVDGERTPCV